MNIYSHIHTHQHSDGGERDDVKSENETAKIPKVPKIKIPKIKKIKELREKKEKKAKKEKKEKKLKNFDGILDGAQSDSERPRKYKTMDKEGACLYVFTYIYMFMLYICV
jgi:uncharacterized Fe-S cluster-containing protein